MDPDLDLIRGAMKRTGGTNKVVVGFFVLLAALSLARFLGSKPDLALVMGGMCLAMAGMMVWLGTRLSPARNPAARALLDEPAAVTEVEHYVTTRGVISLHWFKVRAHGKTFGFQVPRADVDVMAKALARRCPNAAVK